ncbi:MAG: flagellar filament capping protein FliD [Alkaliphilus sp.]
MRIGGLASGIDTEHIVSQLMSAERMRLDRFFQQEQRAKWRQESFNSINKDMANFILDSRKDLGLNKVSSTGSIMQTTVDSFDWVKSATSNNENVVTSSATTNALRGTHIVRVDQLADTARVASSGGLQGAGGVLDADLNFTEAGTFQIDSHNGDPVTISVEVGDSISVLVDAINNATDASGNHLGLSAAYDSALDQLMIVTKDSGASSLIQITDTAGFAETRLNLGATVVGAGVTGQNAIFEFNGQIVNSKETNDFSVFGVNLNLQSVSAETVNIRVDTNTEGILDKVVGFVATYNEMIDKITGQLNQAFNRNYLPLTNEQKEAMSDGDIELWEGKSRSGMLRNDEHLTRMLQNIRSSLYETVAGVPGMFDHIIELGITTGNFRDGGKLVIDETKLRDAINNDPEGVIDVLFKTPDASMTGNEKVANTGIIQRVHDGMIDGMKEIINRSGTGDESSLFRDVRSNMLIDFVTQHGSLSAIDRALASIGERVLREERILASREERYWAQFTAMERAISEMNAQSSWLMSQLGMAQ